MKKLKPEPFRSVPVELASPTTTKSSATSDRKTKLLFLLLLILSCLSIRIRVDNDLWFIMNSGRYVLQHGFPYIEPFTMHPNMHFVMQQWLSGVVFWWIYSKLGIVGVIAFTCLILFCVVMITYRLTRHIANDNLLVAFFTTLFVAVLLAQFFYTRPIIFTLLILISEIFLLERYIDTKKPAYLFPLPLLSTLLVNLHAAMWPMQFVLLLPYVIDSFQFKFLMVQGQGYPKKFFYPAIVLMVAAGFVNPYGLDAMTYLFRSYGYTTFTFIDEMKPANINNLLGMIIFGTFLAVGAIYLLRKKGSTKLRYILLTLGTAVLALSSIRSYVIFIICGIFPLAYFLKDLKLPESKEKPTKKTLRLRVVLIALLSVGLIYLFQSQVTKLMEAQLPPPVAAPVNYLLEHENPDDVVLYTGYNDGAYAEFMGFHPYIDARAEVFVTKNNGTYDIMNEYCSLQYGTLYYKEVLDRYQFTHLLVSKTDILSTYLPHDADYQVVYEDESYLIYEHNKG